MGILIDPRRVEEDTVDPRLVLVGVGQIVTVEIAQNAAVSSTSEPNGDNAVVNDPRAQNAGLRDHLSGRAGPIADGAVPDVGGRDSAARKHFLGDLRTPRLRRVLICDDRSGQTLSGADEVRVGLRVGIGNQPTKGVGVR